jgi:hypothetical protein
MNKELIQNLIQNLIKDIKVSKVLIDNSFEPQLKIEFNISLEKIQDLQNLSDYDSQDFVNIIGNKIWSEIKNRDQKS